jgi:hypothetical protein
LAAGAAKVAETCEILVDKVNTPGARVYPIDVHDWCQGQYELWRALLAWAGELKDGNLRDKFIEKAGAKLPEKPTSGYNKDEFAIHKKYWEFVATRAEALSECWDQRETDTKADSLRSTKFFTLDDIKKWTKEAHEVWKALERWAHDPLDPREKTRFENESKRCAS